MRRVLRALLLSFSLVGTCLISGAGAQTFLEDAGPYSVFSFESTDLDPSAVPGRIYLPWSRGGALAVPPGPFPLVALMHAYIGDATLYGPDAYDELSSHLASHGFVIASVGTQNGTDARSVFEAQDTLALMTWLEGQGSGPSGYGDAWPAIDPQAPHAAIGHSLGGAAAMFLMGLDPRLETVAALMPYTGDGIQTGAFNSGPPPSILIDWDDSFPAVRDFTGNLLVVAAEADEVLVPGASATYFDWNECARRRLLLTYDDMSHLAPWDASNTAGASLAPMPDSEAQRIMRRVCTAFLMAEGSSNPDDDELYDQIIGHQQDLPIPVGVQIRSDFAPAPHFSFRAEPSQARFSYEIAGREDAQCLLLFSFSLAPNGLTVGGSITPFLAPLLSKSGFEAGSIPYSGTIYGQTAYIQGVHYTQEYNAVIGRVMTVNF